MKLLTQKIIEVPTITLSKMLETENIIQEYNLIPDIEWARADIFLKMKIVFLTA